MSATDPAPDARLLRGSAVRLTVSTGRPVVPEVAPGSPVAVAETAVRDAGLVPVQVTSATEFSDSVPTGAVVRTDPGAGTPLASGAPVTLVLSRGVEPPPPPKQVRVPFVIGDKADDAAESLADAGLRAEIESGFPFGRQRGRVVGQDPSPGSQVAPGTTITLTTL